MERTKYREERTLVRGLRRPPSQDRHTFKQNVLTLRRHFEQFNVDVSEICQWLMSIRPKEDGGDKSTAAFWEFFLTRGGSDETQVDSQRLGAFDVVAGLSIDGSLRDLPLSKDLLTSLAAAKRSNSAVKLFERMRKISRPHRMVLLRAAAEWVFARYVRGRENWKRQYEEWEKEKLAWEKDHPELTPEIRDSFNQIFESIGIKEKRPRICSSEKLSVLQDNCDYAGERIGRRNHSPLCKKYREFLQQNSLSSKQKYFEINAKRYLKTCARQPRPSKQVAMQSLLKAEPKARWFPDAWDIYLSTLGITEQTILDNHNWLHCLNFSDEEACVYNPHTQQCLEYKTRLSALPRARLDLEPEYRNWRTEYLRGPKRHSFRYPSSRTLPVPKIFGTDFFEVDFSSNVLRLRLDNMSEGEFLSFGVKPWPPDYDVQPADVEITSVHLNFIGTRARAGFRFKINHKTSRIQVSQDEIDELRSRKYPRQAQDQAFLDEAREIVLQNFAGEPETELKILAVDVGTAGGGTALFVGKTFQEAETLKIIKIDELYDALPRFDKKTDLAKRENAGRDKKKRGLTKEHLSLHLDARAETAATIARIRQSETPELRSHDMRRLTTHIRWMIRDWVRLNASQVIKIAEKHSVDLIVFESMRGFKAPAYNILDQDKKNRLAFFAYGSVRRKVAEKAVERGMRVVAVPEFKTSQFCSRCGTEQEDKGRWRKNKYKRKFSCENKNCGLESNSDENAARVLAKVFWGDLQLPSRLPEKNY